MLATSIVRTYERTGALHDVDDAEGFVAATIERSRLDLTVTEHEELLAEGITILFELADKFEPRRPGYVQAGRFSGYAAHFLPKRLGDAWHGNHPEHRYVTNDDGTRSWAYFKPPVSIDDEESPLEIEASVVEEDWAAEVFDEALERIEPWARFGVRRMLELLRQGYGWDEISRQMNVNRAQLNRMRESLRVALATLDEHEHDAA